MPFCTQCGVELQEEVNFCPECGAQMTSEEDREAEATKICKQCGELMPADMFCCLNCGAPFYEECEDFNEIKSQILKQSGEWKNKWIALLLCIFLGWLGIHRFYEGKVITGILYMCTCGMFGIGWLVDIARIACKPNPYRVK